MESHHPPPRTHRDLEPVEDEGRGGGRGGLARSANCQLPTANCDSRFMGCYLGPADHALSPRTLNDELSIHLVNTSGPHANAPDGGIKQIDPIGPLKVSIRLEQAPKSITAQPEGKPLDVTWADGRATVTVPRLELYSILVVEP